MRVVDAGLGEFLQRVRVEPSLEDGRFVGFRVVELVPRGFWANTDLKPGDVVTHVNSTWIENPNEAYKVFESLREAPAIKVRVVRDGSAKELVFPIVGAPLPGSSRAEDERMPAGNPNKPAPDKSGTRSPQQPEG